MASTYSFAEKKRIRKSFEKISSAMSLPDILEIQTDSYDYFLQNIPFIFLPPLGIYLYILPKSFQLHHHKIMSQV